MPHGLTWDQTRAYSVYGRWLTACAMVCLNLCRCSHTLIASLTTVLVPHFLSQQFGWYKYVARSVITTTWWFLKLFLILGSGVRLDHLTLQSLMELNDIWMSMEHWLNDGGTTIVLRENPIPMPTHVHLISPIESDLVLHDEKPANNHTRCSTTPNDGDIKFLKCSIQTPHSHGWSPRYISR